VPVTAVTAEPTDWEPLIVGTGVNVRGALAVVDVVALVFETDA
jgi:hypothetical protein